MPNRNRHRSRIAGLVVACVALVLAMTGTAGAAGGQGLTVGSLVSPISVSGGSFTPSTLIRSGEGSFGSFSGENPQALTVNQATGDVYAIELSSRKLWRFSSNGTPDDFTAGADAGTNSLTGFNFQGFAGLDQVAVDNSSGPAKGDIYVTESASGRVKVFASTGEPLGTLTGSGTPAGGLGEDCGIAVDDSNGDVYIADRADRIWRYTPSTSVVSETDYSGGIATSIEPCELAAANGNVYAKQWQEYPVLGAGPLDQYAASAFALGEPPSVSAPSIASNTTAVATDPTTGDVYADQGHEISVLDPAGNQIYGFGSSTDFGYESAGVTIDSATGDAYVADPWHQRVDVYGPAFVEPPTATTETASEIHHVKATLNGHLDPNEGPEITSCHFDWGTTTTYGNTAPCEQGNDYTTPTTVSATIGGLEPGKIYHYRLDIATATNTVTGTDQTLETAALTARRELLGTIGPDGTTTSAFSLGEPQALAFRPSTSTLYAVDRNGIYGFDASAPPVYTPISGFNPLATANNQSESGLAVDTTALSSAGNIYLTSTELQKVYGFDSSGTELGGAFPIDPAVTPGPPAGSPNELCGAAVDSTGQVWISNRRTRQILRYSATGAFQGALDFSAEGGSPCGIAFDSNDDLYVNDEGGSTWRFTASSGYTAATQVDSNEGRGYGVTVDQADHHLFIASLNRVREFDSSGHLLVTFAENVPNVQYRTVAVDSVSDHVFVADAGNGNIRVYGPRILPPEVATSQASSIDNTGSTLHGVLDLQGFTLSDCHFAYTTEAEFQTNGFTGAAVAPCNPSAGVIPADLEEHTVSADIQGLERNTTYRYRLLATTTQGTSTTNDATFTTTGPPSVETVGSPVRTATTARLEGRVDPQDAQTTYRFEYGDHGPCDANPCTSTPPQSAGNGNTIEFVSQQITGLEANATYHYRLLADNGNIDGVAVGADRTLTTRSSDAPLTHGHFPGPPDSDRAWEQVNIPDTDGNEVDGAATISDSGERVVYNIEGGSPGSGYGGGTASDGANYQLAERTPNGWKDKSLYPSRSLALGSQWDAPFGSSDLSEVYAVNRDLTNAGDAELWRMTPGAPAQLVLSVPSAEYPPINDFTVVSANGSRVLSVLTGSIDPDHPVGPEETELYDITSGTPQMVGLLPNGTVPPCGVSNNVMEGSEGGGPAEGRVTADGSHVFFSSTNECSDGSSFALYDRDLTNSTTTELAGDARFIRSTDGQTYFTTKESLAADDHGGNDIYRYTIADGDLSCLTCATAAAGSVVSDTVLASSDFRAVAVSNDGSRVYFRSNRPLVQGAATDGIYRLDTANQELAYVAPAEGATVGAATTQGNASSPDGSVFVFTSDNPALDAVNGTQNGGSDQYYIYDDVDRSLVCVSCRADGGLPRGPVGSYLGLQRGSNTVALISNGDFFFVTPTPLVRDDQNTAPPNQEADRGDDLYEWRDGRLLLVSDGQAVNGGGTSFGFRGVSPSGRDVFFTQAARLTPDALEAQTRLYDARIGGGIDFPAPAVPCSLEACQGTASPPPNDVTPSSLSFSGPGNQHESGSSSSKCANGVCVKSHPQGRCAKGRVLKRGKCVKKHQRKRSKRANRNHGGAK